MFMRLTCYSNSRNQALTAFAGSGGHGAPGASRRSPGGAFTGRFAGPGHSVYSVSPEPADSAGWTEVVIQKGRGALSNSIAGRSSAEVNASVSCVFGAASLRPEIYGASRRFVRGDACGRHDSADMSSSRLSCSNNKEVTI